MTTPILRCPRCQDELHKRTDGMYVCLEKTCTEFKKEKTPEHTLDQILRMSRRTKDTVC